MGETAEAGAAPAATEAMVRAAGGTVETAEALVEMGGPVVAPEATAAAVRAAAAIVGEARVVAVMKVAYHLRQPQLPRQLQHRLLLHHQLLLLRHHRHLPRRLRFLHRLRLHRLHPHRHLHRHRRLLHPPGHLDRAALAVALLRRA